MLRGFERLDMGHLDFCLSAHDPRLYGMHRPARRERSGSMFGDDFVCVVDPAHVDVSEGISLATCRRLRHNSVAFGEGVETIIEKARRLRASTTT